MTTGDVTIPAGMSAGFVVVDRTLGVAMAGGNEHDRYRSASLVKLLIALDYLESHGPALDIPGGDRALLGLMLRSSDDDAASALWVRGGEQEIVRRTAKRLGLADTVTPEPPGMWGYTAVSARDITKIYQYILDETQLGIREFLMRALRGWTKRASDGFDQSFGIPSAVSEPGAVKQGWSGFGPAPSGAEIRRRAEGRNPVGAELDLTRRAMHTSGTVGRDDERIFAVLTLHSAATPWETCAQRITALTRVLDQATTDTPRY